MATDRANGKRIAHWISLPAMLFMLAALPQCAYGAEILLGTNEAGSFSHHAGRALCRAVNRADMDLDCKVVPAPDGTHNLTNLNGGSLDLALLDSALLQAAVKRTGQFEFLGITYDNLKILAPCYQQPVALVVRSDAEVGSLSEVKGKRLNIGVFRSQTRQGVDMIFKAKGWTKQDFTVVQELPPSLSQDTMAFCHGSIQAMVHIGVHPDSKLEQVLTLCEGLLLSMDDSDIAKMVSEDPALISVEIQPQTYPTLDQAVSTFGTTVMLMASDSLDGETVQAVMKALQQNQEIIRHAHPALGSFEASAELSSDIGIPRHPGTADDL